MSGFTRGEFEVHIAPAWAMFAHRVWLRQGDYLVGRDGARYPIHSGAVPPDDQAFCEIPHGAGHAFLAELGRALGAVEHPQQLREDYLAERARVDRLIGAFLPKLMTAADLDNHAAGAIRRARGW